MSGALGDLLPSLVAIGQAADGDFAPDRLLDEFSDRIQPRIPHDRIAISRLDDDGRTFTVVAERAVRGPLLHRHHYLSDVARGDRYVVADWRVRTVFAGEPMLIEDFERDPRFREPNPYERAVWEAGFRAGLSVPLRSGGRIIGVMSAMSLTPAVYTADHLADARLVADLIGPVVDNLVLVQRDRTRRARLASLASIGRALGASLNVPDVFARLAEAVKPALDFDVMGVALISSSGRDVEMLVEVDNQPGVEPPWRVPLEDFSFAARIEAGESVLIHDSEAELDPQRPGDRMIIEGGGRSALSAPLWFGEAAGGALYFGKRRPYWFDASDVEIATAIAAQVVVAVQHQRLAADERQLQRAEGRARRLEQRVASLRGELAERFAFEQIVGRAPSLREALLRASKVAPTDTTVLITGESGTGKELVARAIHQASLRADGPFVAINCAALPETLLESELFGHERGAFTGADRQKPGRFELAQSGTLFLDEVGELSAPVQAKLLRVLQERQFERLGGTTTLAADVRLVAATNQSLESLVESGRFRDDLLYRLNVFTVHLPPLRERGDDVILLADHFVRTLGARMGKGEPGLSREARDALLNHAWPGNIRELQNAVERALIVSDGGLITAAQLGLVTRAPRAAVPDARAAGASIAAPASLAEWEKQMVIDALAKARGNKSRAAALLGLTRSQLYTKIKRFGLE